jgi:hypothetical protein
MPLNKYRKKINPKFKGNPIYTFEVFIISGPISTKFSRGNKSISRTIKILGSHTLEDFHEIIFKAFDREEEHMYEFQIGGKGPMDPLARRYGLSIGKEGLFGDDSLSGTVEETDINSLGLKVGDSFAYWFDFGDDWWHQINVVSIEDKPISDKLPVIVNRKGDSPPQYMN